MLFRKETSGFVQKNVKGLSQSDLLYPEAVSLCWSHSLCLNSFFLARNTWQTNDHGCGKNHFLKLLDFHVRAYFISYATSRAILEIVLFLSKA